MPNPTSATTAKHVATRQGARDDSIRFAPHVYNTYQDVDRLFSVLRGNIDSV